MVLLGKLIAIIKIYFINRKNSSLIYQVKDIKIVHQNEPQTYSYYIELRQ